MFNITLTHTSRDEIIATQKPDESMGHIKRRMQERWPEGCLFPRGCRRDHMVQGNICGAQERILEEEDFGWSLYVEVLHSSWEH
jgi:hypothetical protein